MSQLKLVTTFHAVEDEIGDKQLADRVPWLRHVKTFVGLSWLTWGRRTICQKSHAKTKTQ
jgi:hypothetical protein